MKLQLTTLLLLFTLFTYSQTNFEKGYFINTNGDNVECLIKNEDWSNNPTDFKYKLTEGSEIQTGNITQIIEFGIGNSFKFIKEEVDVDISTNHVSNLSYLSEPEWEKRTVYLKVLISGKASLYFYASPGINRYFYNLENGKVVQLIHKRYQTFDRNIKVNNDFRQQLYNSFLDCNSLEIKDFNAVNYNQPSLSKIIKSYNDCSGSNSNYFETNNANLSFNLKVKGGLNVTTLNNLNYPYNSNRNASFGNILGYRVAVEGEVILPFRNNKWSIFLEMAKVQKVHKETENQAGKVEFTYDFFEIPIGVRYYMFLSQDSKLSLHAGHARDLFPSLEVNYESNGGFKNDAPSGSWFFGAGYHFNNISIETRLNIKAVIERNTPNYSSDYNNLSLTLGYTLF
ncbi:MAG: hypothetical protein R2785_11955 [Flavobacteriaceae bacterium]